MFCSEVLFPLLITTSLQFRIYTGVCAGEIENTGGFDGAYLELEIEQLLH